MGRSVRAASITGVRHAIVTSVDADLVTLVSALSLFFLATASVKGFGLTLALGIICDIVMMLLFKAPIIRLLAPKCIAKHPGFWGVKDCKEAAPYFQGEKPASSRHDVRGRFIKLDINLLGYRKVFLSVAAVAVVLVVALVGVRGVNFGIEFVGGTSVTFHQGGNDATTEQVRSAFADAGEPDAVVQTTDSDGQAGFLVRTTDTSAESAAAAANKVADQFGWDAESFEVTTIGPDWGASVIQSSCIAFFVSLLLIIAYISVRFRDPKMGVSAVIALLHDLVIVLGVYVLVGREVTPNTIAALLTILGYSLYDTVVVFHRINDNMRGDDIKCTFMTMANHSINQVLVRTINTTLTSLIPVLAMLFFGGETLKDFAFAMAIGLIAGSYSSIAIACPLYCMWKTREPKFAKLQKKYGTEVGLFEFDHSASTGIAQVPLARLEANARAEAYVAEQKEATGEAPDAAAVAAAVKPKPVNNKKKKHRHGRAQ